MSDRHGTLNGYTNHRCRCPLCTMAASDYHRDWKQQRQKLAPDDPRHGTENGYINYGCRCTLCKAARSQQRKKILDVDLGDGVKVVA